MIISSIFILPIIVAPSQSEWINYIVFTTTNPQSDHYTSNDGEKFQSMVYDENLVSQSFNIINEKYNGIFYYVLPPVKSQNFYILPHAISCITGLDFIDPNNSGHKQWVFRCDLKSNPAYSPFQELLNHIHELSKEVTSISHPIYWNRVHI